MEELYFLIYDCLYSMTEFELNHTFLFHICLTHPHHKNIIFQINSINERHISDSETLNSIIISRKFINLSKLKCYSPSRITNIPFIEKLNYLVCNTGTRKISHLTNLTRLKIHDTSGFKYITTLQSKIKKRDIFQALILTQCVKTKARIKSITMLTNLKILNLYNNVRLYNCCLLKHLDVLILSNFYINLKSIDFNNERFIASDELEADELFPYCRHQQIVEYQTLNPFTSRKVKVMYYDYR